VGVRRIVLAAMVTLLRNMRIESTFHPPVAALLLSCSTQSLDPVDERPDLIALLFVVAEKLKARPELAAFYMQEEPGGPYLIALRSVCILVKEEPLQLDSRLTQTLSLLLSLGLSPPLLLRSCSPIFPSSVFTSLLDLYPLVFTLEQLPTSFTSLVSLLAAAFAAAPEEIRDAWDDAFEREFLIPLFHTHFLPSPPPVDKKDDSISLSSMIRHLYELVSFIRADCPALLGSVLAHILGFDVAPETEPQLPKSPPFAAPRDFLFHCLSSADQSVSLWAIRLVAEMLQTADQFVLHSLVLRNFPPTPTASAPSSVLPDRSYVTADREQAIHRWDDSF
jgi:hypothetical protein